MHGGRVVVGVSIIPLVRAIIVHTLLEVLRSGMDELHGGELEATLLEAGDDGANETALDGIGLWRRSNSQHRLS